MSMVQQQEHLGQIQVVTNDWAGMVQVRQLLLLQHKMLTMLKHLKEYQNTNLGVFMKIDSHQRLHQIIQMCQILA